MPVNGWQAPQPTSGYGEYRDALTMNVAVKAEHPLHVRTPQVPSETRAVPVGPYWAVPAEASGCAVLRSSARS